MEAFPDVTLATPFIAQTEYKSDFVDVLQISDDVAGKNLRAYCQLVENPSLKYWITLLSVDDYTYDCTNQEVTNAIEAYFVNP